MASFLNNVMFQASALGNVDFVVSLAIAGFQTPALAGAVDGAVYRYHAETDNRAQWEIGYGAYTVATQTLARTAVLYNSSGTGSGSGQSGAGNKISFISLPRVGLVALAQDFDIDAQAVQTITAGGAATVENGATIVRVNQTVGAPIALTMPLSTVKTCPVLISDWKMDAGTNNITINLSGSDKFPGNLTSWTIAGDGGSVFLRPIPGVGYAL